MDNLCAIMVKILVTLRAWQNFPTNKSKYIWRPLTDWVPGRHDDPPIVRVCLDGVYDLCQLIHPLPAVVSVHINIFGTKVTPLEPIHWTEITWTKCVANVINIAIPNCLYGISSASIHLSPSNISKKYSEIRAPPPPSINGTHKKLQCTRTLLVVTQPSPTQGNLITPHQSLPIKLSASPHLS